MNNELAIQTLKDCNIIFDKLKINFWLTCGTLLGQQRENDFIAYDKDIDIAVHIKDFTPQIRNEFIRRGYTLVHTYGTINAGLEVSFRKINGPKLDIFFMYDGPGFTMWNAVWIQEAKIQTLYRMATYTYTAFKLGRCTFHGEKYYIPKDSGKFLEEQYGDWHTLDPNWKWHTSPKNICYTNHFSVKNDPTVFPKES